MGKCLLNALVCAIALGLHSRDYPLQMNRLSFAHRSNADLIDQNYEAWRSDPESVDAHWQAFFEGFDLGMECADGDAVAAASTADTSQQAIIQSRIIGALYAYRSIGHTQAKINPLKTSVPPNPRLSLERLGLSEAVLDESYHTGNYLNGVVMPVRELLDRLTRTYCGSVGCEYIHIQETSKRRWLQARMEPDCNTPSFTPQQELRILRKLYEAETFERFLHTRYVGQKRFSLEGAETLIPCLDAIIEKCPEYEVAEIVMGMAHRGRLNVLANIVGKSYEFIFREFSENYIPDTIHGDGDVKYHLGYNAVRKTSGGGEVELRLAPNPSHLEAVNPIVEGNARARQRLRGDLERKKVLPLLIHGDAALAGQGMVAEVFNLSQLKGYRTGGTIHIVVNNQIGFTTDPRESRSSRYCTDIAKMIEVPIFHVNGDDPLAVIMVAEMALEYRQQFSEDVVIDMYCYRKHGHNEADEPGFTQPALYKAIAKHRPISEQLAAQLIEQDDLTAKEADRLRKEYEQTLDDAFQRVKRAEENPDRAGEKLRGSSAVYQPPYAFKDVKTAVSKEKFEKVARALTSVPGNFKLNPKIKRQLEAKREAALKGGTIDWAFAEQLAFGTLMLEGTPVRLSGQDSERGTFSQRHAAFYDIETGVRYVPLLNLDKDQAMFCVHNSCLSEAAVLGFDFGYSMDYPEMLGIWEAQFGDFVNGAQVIIDQFITSSESKWQRVSGLVMLLPHGYEGQGPEHSSARLERFLQACAEDNIQVCNVTTPAQYFHLLRRQMRREFLKPLIVMAPKSLLRHKECVSPVKEFLSAPFSSILDDPGGKELASAKRLVLCCGKVYYDLTAHRKSVGCNDTAILRVEQLYPFNSELLKKVVARYPKAETIVWCQEEPQNMGAWTFIAPLLQETLNQPIAYAGRQAAASPAPGSLAMHNAEQKTLLEDAFSVTA